MVLGQYSSANSTALISPSVCELAKTRFVQHSEGQIDPYLKVDEEGNPILPDAVLGVDCGRYGDPSVFCIVRGNEPPIFPDCGIVRKGGMLYTEGKQAVDGQTIAHAISLIVKSYPQFNICPSIDRKGQANFGGDFCQLFYRQ